jgi:hypothetical protein
MTLNAHHDPMTDAQRDERCSVVRTTFLTNPASMVRRT